MKKIVVNGGRRLSGEIRASGSKNAALPLIFASMLARGRSVLLNVPRIGDVFVALDIMSELGAEIDFRENRLVIDTEHMRYVPPSPTLVSKIRASTYLIGASLARFGKFLLSDFGGCSFSLRPIDLHIKSAISLGAKMEGNTLVADGLSGTKIELEKPSVGASINTLIMAAGAKGITEIRGFAKEPHVLSVIDFLRSMGADITLTDQVITVKSAPLSPTEFSVIGDMIEAGTYITFALITDGEIKVTGFDPTELSAFISALSDLGYTSEIGADFIAVNAENHNPKSEANPYIIADPYPGFPTDLQPIIAPLLAHNEGGKITDNVWQGRFGYLDSLTPFGLRFDRDISSAKIEKSGFSPAITVAPDLRGGAASLAAALSAKGVSEIHSPNIILRGYEDIIEKLTSLGADIKLVNL
jgi:UDP-N-acetylglucosamine 1-carboxyvinyltransferase